MSARVIRNGIAAFVAIDACLMAGRVTLAGRNLYSPPLVDTVLIGFLSRHAWLTIGLALVSVAAMYGFAKGRASVAAAITALVANHLIQRVDGSITGIYSEDFYHTGAALLGWTMGVTMARRVAPPLDEKAVASLGALGAAAVFGATYLNAGTSKLFDAGTNWLSTDTIRLAIMMERKFGAEVWSDAIKDFFLSNGIASRVLEFGTYVIQIGACLFPWTPRTRLVGGLAFVAFHLGIHVLTGIYFFQAIALALLFAVPWGQLSKTREGTTDPLTDVSGDAGQPVIRELRRWIAVVMAISLLLPSTRHPIERDMPEIEVNGGIMKLIAP